MNARVNVCMGYAERMRQKMETEREQVMMVLMMMIVLLLLLLMMMTIKDYSLLQKSG